MTAPDTFDLEPEQDLDRPGDPLPPERPGLRRTRTAIRRRGAAPAPPWQGAGSGDGIGRFFGWVVSPTFYYVLALASAVGVLFGLFNPAFGHAGRYWPYEALGDGADPLVWGPAQVRVIALLAPIVATIVALCMQPGRRRAVLVAVAFLLPLLAFEGPAWPLLPALIGLLAGVLVGGAPGQRHRRLLAVALIVVGGLLGVPRGLEADAGASTGHASSAVLLVEVYTNPPDAYFEEPDPDRPAAGGGWLRILGEHQGETTGLVLLGMGLLALLGLGRRWVRWAAGGLLLSVYLGLLGWQFHTHWDGWEAGVAGWAGVWFGASAAYMLPFAGAVAELGRTRR